MIKLPKPLATEGVWYPNGADKPGVVGDCYTAEQMLQFSRDALEAVTKPTEISVRDYFAAKAMQAMCDDVAMFGKFAACAKDAYKMADAMLAERNKT